MKRILWILPLFLAVSACKGENAPKSTYSANPGTTGYSAPAPGMRRPGGAPKGMARAGSPAAPPPRSAPPVVRTVPMPPPMPTAPRPAASSLPTSGSFRWASSLREAQDAARATGRMVFIETGRPACGNCQALRNDVIPNPAVSGELGAASVGYYTDCDVEPNAQAFLLLTSNLPNAATLPLVGFFTPDLRFVHGYSGGRNVSRFRQEIATARAAYQRLASMDRPGSSLETAALPARSLGSLPDAELADVSLELADDRMLDADSVGGEASPERALVVAPTAPAASGPSVAEAAAVAAAARQAAVARAEEQAREAAALEAERIAAEDRERAVLAAALRAAPEIRGTAIVSPRAMPALIPAPSAEPASPATSPAGEGATPPATVEAPSDVRAWAQAELRRAALAISTGDFTSARAIFADVRAKAAGAPEAREAAKGDVAIWNLRKVERAGTPDDAVRLRARAKADLESTVFESLFD